MADSERDVLAEALPDTEADWRPFWHRVNEPDGWVVSVYGDRLAEHVIAALAARGWRLVPSCEACARGDRDTHSQHFARGKVGPAAQPSAEPGLDVAADADARIRTAEPPQSASDEFKAGWHHAISASLTAIARARLAAALTPDRPTPGEAT